MCGIAGILVEPNRSAVELVELQRMVAMLGHRGPDGYGLYRDSRVGLAHSRLSIIDLEGGHQPMTNEDETIWITFNGEVFNYVELRAELKRSGHQFRTQSDTEVIIHSFEQYGAEAWKKLNGQFAFALWDSRARKLWLVRDRIGILPLQYARVDGRILFASEAKALFASGHLCPRFSGTGLAEVFTRWAATAPSTVFEGVHSVRPGMALCFDEELRERESCYWQSDLSGAAELKDISLDEAAEALGEKLDRAVRLRLRADVPVGAYLSGGLDSSVISHLIRQAGSSDLQTFAVRFKDPAFDETAEQRQMAKLLGTRHHEILCGAGEIRQALPEVVWHCETPLLRTAPAPLFLLSQLVNRCGMRVVLTGEGADEFLAGYHIFKADKIRRFWARRPDSGMRSALLTRLYPYVAGNSGAKNPLWQRFFRYRLLATDHPFYSHLIRWHGTAWSLRLLAPELRGDASLDRFEDESTLPMPACWRDWSPLARAQAVEIQTFLSSYLLSCQGDRVAMGHSVEVRYPFLDPDVVDFCSGLPNRLKLRGLRDKVALRRLASRFLPEQIHQRPKQPYRAPTTTVLFGQNAPDYVDDLLSEEALARFGAVDPGPAGKLIAKARRQGGRMGGEREEMALVALLSLQLLGHFFMREFPHRVSTSVSRLTDSRLLVFEDRHPAQREEIPSSVMGQENV